MRGRLELGILWIGALASGLGAGLTLGRQPTELWFLSVGQGDCAVFRHAGLTVLIDVGPAMKDVDTSSTRILRDLRQMGVSRIDVALLSHLDSDHIGGLRGLAGLIPIGKVAAMRHFEGNTDLDEWLAAAGIRKRDVLWLDPGSQIKMGQFVARIDSDRYIVGDPDNHGSMFVRLAEGAAAADFTGDADALAELAVMHDGEWSAQVLKAGHHGSRTSTCEAWLAAVKPATVVITCGRNNVYGHPAKETLARIARAGAKVARTDTEGDIRFEVRDDRFVRVR